MPRANRRAEDATPAPLGLDNFPSDEQGPTTTTVDALPESVEGDRPEEENLPESSGDRAAAERPTIVIEPGRKWSEWPDIQVFNGSLAQFFVTVDDHHRLQLNRRHPDNTEEQLGAFDYRALRELGWMTKFPAPFIRRLTDLELASQVINSRIRDTKPKDISVIGNGEMVTNIAPGWREIMPYREVCQLVFDDVRSFVEAEPEVERCEVMNGGLLFRIVTDRQQPITPRKGDVLEMGIEARSHYGGSPSIALYTRRLACLNGATAQEREFSWRSSSSGTIEDQRLWLHQGVIEVLSHYDGVVTRCRQMAAVRFTGNPRDVLREHARAVRLPSRYVEDLIDSFNQEPGDTYYDLYNAMTRLATHGGLDERNARRLMLSAGTWSEEFDMVRCRLPRPVAERLGAEILDEQGFSEGDRGIDDEE